MITFEELEEKDWRKIYSPLDDEFPCYEKKIGDYYLSLTYGLSNKVDCDWSLHVDNQDRQSVGNVDVNSYEKVLTFLSFIDEKILMEGIIQEEADRRYPDLEYESDMYKYHGFIEGATWMIQRNILRN